MSVMHVDIVSLEGSLFSGKAIYLSLPGEEGVLGVHPGHVPLFTRLQLGPVRVQCDNQSWVDLVIAGGVLEVTATEVVVLADHARRTQASDQAAIEQAYAAAERLLAEAAPSQDHLALERELAMLKAQLLLLRRHRH